ncbi:hypothetical protein [Thermobifida cellulosilytica]|uniref:Uncharacterized protein n=1 Tax=Thermobifida cellulosilytica TB100 TaxID=665004 RepID=A0A147KKK1_THECS|nr:hypothetical protein [Thermobifida cellulosilytica]KUP97751.1 hypothetical protein AC529_04610 [Thermobifida cellulosilytica TB100]
MSHTDTPVTLYAGPLDGLALPAAVLTELVHDHGSERLLFLTRFGVPGLYRERGGRWVYASPGLLGGKVP